MAWFHNLPYNEGSSQAAKQLASVARGALRYRGGRTGLTYFAEEGVFFKTSECPQFCIKRVFFGHQVRGMGDENPLKIHKIYASLTPSDSRSDVGCR